MEPQMFEYSPREVEECPGSFYSLRYIQSLQLSWRQGKRLLILADMGLAGWLICFSLSVSGAHAQNKQPTSNNATPPNSIRVMTFNLWHGGDAGKQPLAQSIEVIRRSGADVVGLQETHGYPVDGHRADHGPAIAKELGWNYIAQPGRRGILSRFPLGAATLKNWGVGIALPNDRKLMMFNVHFAAAPYQPYQLLKIPYFDAPFIETEKEAIDWAIRSRGSQVTTLIRDMQQAITQELPIVVTGDFNEPSFQDWTEAAARAKLCPLAVEYPSTRRVSDLGMVDTYRAIYSDEVANPGWTWTPITSPDDPKDKHDRIDFVFASPHWTILNCQRVCETKPDRQLQVQRAKSGHTIESETVVEVTPWPSDHRAVVATLLLKSD